MLIASRLEALPNAASPRLPNVTGAHEITATDQAITTSNSLVFFGRPIDLAISPDSSTIAVKTSHNVTFVDATSWQVLQVLPLPPLRDKPPPHLGGNAAAGIVWNPDGSEVWETDGFSVLHGACRLSGGPFSWCDGISLPSPPPAILRRTGSDGNTLGAAPIGVIYDGSASGWVTLSRNNTVALVNFAQRRVIAQVATGVAPYEAVVANGKLYVTNWGGSHPSPGDAVAFSSGSAVRIDRQTGVADSGSVTVVDREQRRALYDIPVGLHPTAIVASSDQARLYVANSNGDSISVIDTHRDKVVGSYSLLAPGEPIGRAPDALALSNDGRTLFVAEGGANLIAALNLETGRVDGVHRTAWYPSAIGLRGASIYVASLKGAGSKGVAFHLPIDFRQDRAGGYNVYDFAGTIQRFTLENWQQPTAAPALPVSAGLLRRLFHHVIVIIKENHTYDDIYGDLRYARGDPALCLFCSVAVNQHALARRFGIFDNFYVNGTLSADGHNWMNEGYATDYLERSLASWARSYPSAGNDPLAYSSAGFIWNRALSAGLTFHDYGEFIPDIEYFTKNGVRDPSITWSDVYRDYQELRHSIAWEHRIGIVALAPFVDQNYPAFSLLIPDQYRASIFLQSLLSFSRRGLLPNLILLSLPNDHTAFGTPLFPTPQAFAADNDVALGRIVSGVTKSPFWNDTLILVVEDDAQDGVDHIDGHRTAALVISAHNKSDLVDAHFYNQTSILRTVELIFDLKPLTWFDANAPPIVFPFQQRSDTRPYTALASRIPFDRLNPVATTQKQHKVSAVRVPVIHEDAFDGER